MAKQPKTATARTSKVGRVSIAKMRVPPAGVSQRKFSRAQGEEIASNLDLDKLGLPIVNVRDGIPWVLDGQHRIYALKENGFEAYEIECEIYEGLSDAEMADIFLGRDDRRPINVFEKFQVACTAERKRETDIRRTVESQGLKISQTKDAGCIGAVGALGRVYDRAGAAVLGQALRTIRDAYGGDPNAFDGELIQGLGLIYNRYNGKTDEKALATALSAAAHGVRGLMRRAEAQRERTGNQKSHCVAATVVDIYNKGLGPRAGKRLPTWWKEA
jgi:hypothetical protein